MDIGNDLDLTLGGGFLRGTIYDSTIAHHSPTAAINRVWNSAYDLNATLSGQNFDVMAECNETTNT